MEKLEFFIALLLGVALSVHFIVSLVPILLSKNLV
jgi:hypothetical protein